MAADEREAQPLGPVAELGEQLLGLVVRGADLEQRRRGGRAAGRPADAEHVAVGGHRADVGLCRDQSLRRGEVGDQRDAVEQPAKRRAQQLRRA